MSRGLKHCPFCGEMPNVEIRGCYNDYDKSFYVSCVNPRCKSSPYTREYHETEQAAINAWNKRHFDYDAILKRKARLKNDGKAFLHSLLDTVYGEGFVDEFLSQER